ncbi:class I SAM-dependent methyltransferase [Longispora urticae]
MSTDPYRDPDLVELYDLDNPAGSDHAYYRALADGLDARTIIDLGCGTGLLTRALAGPGRVVFGVDPSATMLAYARSRPGSGAVTWLPGDARAVPVTGTADLAVCTGNSIMHIGDGELPATLAALAGALRPGGVLAFESRDPRYREWEHWTPDATYGERTTPFGLLKEWIDVTGVSDGRVVFDAHNVFPDGEDRIYRTTLYFRTATEFRRELAAAGFTDVVCAGDWEGGPAGDSGLLVFRARRG